ncbi:MAG: hypothetical protein J5803_03690, partial [Desulfovibrio sp.]|nr:hypothetical protein [Desulfovibrio sp.]
AEEKLTLSGIAITSSLIEETFGQRLPLPHLMHMNLALGVEKKEGKDHRLFAGIGVDELFDLQTEIVCALDGFEDIVGQLAASPLHDFSISFKDNSLLARIAYTFAPNASKDFLLSQLQQAKDPEEKAVAEKLTLFVEQPGTLTIASTPGTTVSFPELTEMSEDKVIRLFTLSVTPGKESFDTQIARIQAEN